MGESNAILKFPSNLPSTRLKMGEGNAIFEISQQPGKLSVKNGRE